MNYAVFIDRKTGEINDINRCEGDISDYDGPGEFAILYDEVDIVNLVNAINAAKYSLPELIDSQIDRNKPATEKQDPANK